MGFTRVPHYIPIMTAKASTGIGTSCLINDYKNVMLKLVTAGSADMTIKVQGSLQSPTNQPTFSSAASATNQWDYVACWDLVDSTLVDGTTGLVASGTDLSKNLLVNVDGLVWLNVVITARAAGSATVTAVVYNNT